MKNQFEQSLGMTFSDEEFEKARAYALRKQKRIIELGSKQAYEQYYLDMLIEEQLRQNIFSRFTRDLCEALNMERTSTLKADALESTHIVAQSAV